MMRRSFLFLPFAAHTAQAHSYKTGGIKVGHAWALPQIAGQDGQCFMPLLNNGTEPDVLLAARSEVTSLIQLRRNARYDDPPETQFALAPMKPIAMRPQAVHLRLLAVRRALELGDRFPLILDFMQAGELEVEVHVENSPGE
jgi:periplasmic copper chaperone A